MFCTLNHLVPFLFTPQSNYALSVHTVLAFALAPFGPGALCSLRLTSLNSYLSTKVPLVIPMISIIESFFHPQLFPSAVIHKSYRIKSVLDTYCKAKYSLSLR